MFRTVTLITEFKLLDWIERYTIYIHWFVTATFADFESIYRKNRYIKIFDISKFSILKWMIRYDTIRYIDIKTIYRYFRYIDPSLVKSKYGNRAIPLYRGHRLVMSVLLYAAETWTMLACDTRAWESFHMKCHRQIRQIKWHQFVRNDDITSMTAVPTISSIILHRRNAVFGHIARLQGETPANKALRCHVNLMLRWPPSRQWKWLPGWPRCR